MKPSEINAIIRELKKNRDDMLPKCKLPLSVCINNLSEYLGQCVDYLDIRKAFWHQYGSGRSAGGIYSLPADFPEVPEVTGGWVVAPVDDDGLVDDNGLIDGIGGKVHWYSWRSVLLDRPPLTHFGGYLWESKRYPGRYTMSCDLLGLDAHGGSSTVPSCWVEPLTPKALRFWCTDVAKACTLGFKPWNADEWP
jgi:hypothetical protein